MSMNIRFPNITASTEREQINQIKSYLHQLVEQLNYVLPKLGTGDGTSQDTSTDTAYELRSMIMQELQKVQNVVDTLDAKYIESSGWPADSFLLTDANGKVIAGKLKFTIGDDGNINYEVEE